MDLRLGGHAGGIVGWGTTTGTPDMFRQAAGPGFGIEPALKLLIFDFSVDVLQIIKSCGLGATLIQVMLGMEFDIPAGHTKLENGQSAQVVHTGAAAGFVFGTTAPAMLPLTNDQLSDKGFSSRMRVGVRVLLQSVHGRRRASRFRLPLPSSAGRR